MNKNFTAANKVSLALAWALAMAAPAYAQDTGLNADDNSGEIIVTAQRVATLASKTPIALTAIEGSQLLKQGVDNPVLLAEQAPNLSIVRNNGLQITIRGVTSSDNSEKGDPSASFLADGVYIARPQAQEVSFYDIDRVEVLRGPQGTLYGRNTTAGVINVITNRPKKDFQASGNLTAGNYGTWRADAMLNVPVGEMVAFRVAGAMERRDSYFSKVAGDTSQIDPFKENYSVRGQALFTFSDALQVLLRADYSSLYGRPQSTVLGSRFYARVPTGAPAYTDPAYIGASSSSRQLREIGYDLVADPRNEGHTWGFDGELNWNLGLVTMTYLGSYREFQFASQVAAIRPAGSYLSTSDGDYKQVSQELRFSLNDIDGLQAQFGGYYFNEKSFNSLVLPGSVGFEQGPTKSETYGLFGQLTYSLTDALRVTGGGRYSHDAKSRIGRQFNPVTNATISPNNASTESSKITWRLGLDYDLNSRSLLYAVASTGYKAGGFNGGCEAGTPNCTNPRPNAALYYDPETLTAYEIGLKTRFLDNAVRLNAAAFYYDYSNLQVSSIGEFNGVPQQITLNAAAATVKGIELEGILTPSSRNRIDLSMTYLDAKYDSYRPLGAGTLPNFEGKELDRAPRWVASAGYSYTLPLENGSSLSASIRTRITDEYFLASQTTGQRFRQPSFSRTDASITYTADGDRYYIQAFVNNLENSIQVTAAGISLGSLTVAPSDPLTYGGRVGFKF